jgi:hypothetical protein
VSPPAPRWKCARQRVPGRGYQQLARGRIAGCRGCIGRHDAQRPDRLRLNFRPRLLGPCRIIRRGHWTCSKRRNPFEPGGELTIAPLAFLIPDDDKERHLASNHIWYVSDKIPRSMVVDKIAGITVN